MSTLLPYTLLPTDRALGYGASRLSLTLTLTLTLTVRVNPTLTPPQPPSPPHPHTLTPSHPHALSLTPSPSTRNHGPRLRVGRVVRRDRNKQRLNEWLENAHLVLMGGVGHEVNGILK